MERDPFGRKTQEILGSPAGYVEIPEMSDVQQSRRILAELYRRAGQPERSEQERKYIERLLQWY
jgi:RNA polymerase-interacting CarD/CdnL/TRCF family regulator